MPNFIKDNVQLPVEKTDKNPVTDATRQIAAADYKALRDAANGTRDYILGNAAGVLPWGAYGDGSDGDATIAVNTTLARDTFYNNLTVNVGVILRTGGFRVHVAGLLTLNGTIDNSGYTGGNGGNGAAGTSGAGGDTGSTGGGGAGGLGGNNGGGAAGTGANPAPRGMLAGGAGGTGGAGGGAGGNPAIAGASAGELRSAFAAFFAKHPATMNTNLVFGSGGGGGHSNGAGSGGGGGGGGGGYCYVAARSWTGAGSITAKGGKGGDAFASGGVASGGGGGGSGGWVTFVTRQGAAPSLSVAGGLGGARSGFGGSTDGSAGNVGVTQALGL